MKQKLKDTGTSSKDNSDSDNPLIKVHKGLRADNPTESYPGNNNICTYIHSKYWMMTTSKALKLMFM